VSKKVKIVEEIKREITVKKAIALYFADGDGGWNKGQKHAFTVEDIIHKLEIPNNSDNRRIVQVEILQELKNIRLTENILAGGISRNPTRYLIADTEKEKATIVARHMNYTSAMIGGLESRLEVSDSPVLVAMVSAISGMVKSLNALTIAIKPKEKEEEDDEQSRLIK